ncbi:MAG: response regulator [Flavobacteriales bacterium]|nr:response regulator [Flavobacteriales bacterium]MBP9080837.1 response regulator [Flavobacteriales bacterium]
MRRALPILLALSLLPAQRVQAQWDTLTMAFRAITINDGLSQGMVTAILQDRHGFMWFATKDGLNRYDGYRFEVFRHDTKDSTSLSDNNVHLLFEDRAGRLWVGTDRGLDVFDRPAAAFRHALTDLTPGEDRTHQMVQDANGDLWLARIDGLRKLTLTGADTARNRVPAFTIQHLLDRSCWVTTDRGGTVWASELERRSYRLAPTHGGVDRMDTLRLKQSIGSTRRGRTLVDLTGLVTVEDTLRGRLYGLHKYGIVLLTSSSSSVEPLFTYPSALGDMRATMASLDAEGRLWICAFKGIFLFEPATNRLRRVLPMDPNFTQRAGVVQMNYRDRSGLLWIGTSGYGLLTHDPRTERFHTVAGMSCGPMTPVAQGRISISLNTHLLSAFDPATGAWPLALPFDTYMKRKALDVFSPAGRFPVQDGEGTWWLNYGGLMSYSEATDGFTPHPRDAADRAAFPLEESCSPILLDGDSLIWFGSEHGIGRFRRRDGRYAHWLFPPEVHTSGSGQVVQALQRATDGTFWIGTVSGLLHFDPRTQAWKRFASDPGDVHSLSSDAVFSICPDPDEGDGVLWIGTNGGGLNKLDTRTGTAVRYTTEQGLPNNVVYGVLSDGAGRLWMSTNKGIARFDRATGVFRNYTASDGLQGDEFNRYAYCKLPDGTLFFGGVNGFNRFKPEHLLEDSTADPIHITGIRLINKPVDFRAAGSPLKAPTYLSKAMTIPFSVNMVTFEFATMAFSAPQEHHYRYLLEGFDKDWIQSGTERSAVYTNLDPGRYTFRVQGVNRDGVWAATGASFSLTVLPPWWRTWWAWSLYILVVAGGIITYIRLRTHGLKRQRALLERTVAERTTELNRRKDEADAQRERAEHSERVKQQFLANMSHEIRTPMNAIVGMGNVLRRNAHLPAQQQYIDAITTSSESLLGIVNEILDLSKIESGKLELEKVRMEPHAVLQGVVEVLHYRAEEKGLKLACNVDPKVPSAVQGDPVRLNQVLMNLVGNAIKFSEHGSVRVALAVQEQLTDAVMLRFAVSDTGIGIAADRLAHVFEDFMQAESDHTRKYGGTGLGLAISKRLVEMQGGTIGVASELGQGSTFTFTVPYAHAHADASRPDNGQRATDNLPRGLHILLVEDNKLNVLVAEEELKYALPGCTVDVAENGRAALDMHAVDAYDLILMDVQMPVMDGYAATRAIRAMGGSKARIPIVAMTANVMQVEVQQCRDAGMDAFIPKPFKQEELVAAIGEAMGNNR